MWRSGSGRADAVGPVGAQQQLLAAIRVQEIVQREVPEHDEHGIRALLGVCCTDRDWSGSIASRMIVSILITGHLATRRRNASSTAAAILAAARSPTLADAVSGAQYW